MEIIEDNREPAGWNEWDYSEVHGACREIQKDVGNLVSFITRLENGSPSYNQRILSYIAAITEQLENVRKRVESYQPITTNCICGHSDLVL